MIRASIIFGFIFAMAVFTQWMAATGVLKASTARKILHLTAITASACAVLIVEELFIVFYFSVFSLPVLFGLIWGGFFTDAATGRRSWGILYFALAYASMLFLFESNRLLIFYSMLILALADGFAAIVGEAYGKTTYRFGQETKTLEGSLAFFVFAVVSLIMPSFLPGVNIVLPIPLVLIFILSIFLAVIEALSVKGLDNLWLPLAATYWLLLDSSFIAPVHLLIFTGILAAALLAFSKSWLSLSGALAAVVLGTVLLVSPGPLFSLPAFVFFILGSLVSKLPVVGDGKPVLSRNANQVFANGAAPVGFLALFYLTGVEAFAIGGISGFAAALSDTFSSEIGVRYGKNAVGIGSLKSVKPGLSGGVTINGSIAGIVGAFIMAILSFLFIQKLDYKALFIIIFSGILGNIIDSILGHFFQVKYFYNGRWNDIKDGQVPEKVKGLKFISNDAVNFTAVSFSALIGAIIFSACK